MRPRQVKLKVDGEQVQKWLLAGWEWAEQYFGPEARPAMTALGTSLGELLEGLRASGAAVQASYKAAGSIYGEDDEQGALKWYAEVCQAADFERRAAKIKQRHITLRATLEIERAERLRRQEEQSSAEAKVLVVLVSTYPLGLMRPDVKVRTGLPMPAVHGILADLDGRGLARTAMAGGEHRWFATDLAVVQSRLKAPLSPAGMALMAAMAEGASDGAAE